MNGQHRCDAREYDKTGIDNNVGQENESSLHAHITETIVSKRKYRNCNNRDAEQRGRLKIMFFRIAEKPSENRDCNHDHHSELVGA